jgi:hypothetical protein
MQHESNWLQALVDEIVEKESEARGYHVPVDDLEVIRRVNTVLFQGMGDSMRHRAIQELAAQRAQT